MPSIVVVSESVFGKNAHVIGRKRLEMMRDRRALPNVSLTPHIGSHTPDANRRMAAAALRNMELAEAGWFEAMSLLNPEVLQPGVS